MDFCGILVLVLLNACLEENIVRFDQYSSEDSLLDIGLKKGEKLCTRGDTALQSIPCRPQSRDKILKITKISIFIFMDQT